MDEVGSVFRQRWQYLAAATERRRLPTTGEPAAAAIRLQHPGLPARLPEDTCII